MLTVVYGRLLIVVLHALLFILGFCKPWRCRSKKTKDQNRWRRRKSQKVRYDHCYQHYYCLTKLSHFSRAHLNDLESIPAFIITSFAYILTNPEIGFATLLFRAFTAARFIHTFVYAVYVVPQPSRALAFMVGLLVTLYMAVVSICHFM